MIIFHKNIISGKEHFKIVLFISEVQNDYLKFNPRFSNYKSKKVFLQTACPPPPLHKKSLLPLKDLISVAMKILRKNEEYKNNHSQKNICFALSLEHKNYKFQRRTIA